MGKAIAGLTFIGMLFYGADLITAIVGSIILLTLFSGLMWLQEQSETNTQSFAKWYGLTIMVSFVILAIVLFNQ